MWPLPTLSSSSCLAAGQSGLGKSTLVNTLFKSQVSRKASSWNREEKIPKTVEIKAIGHGEDQPGYGLCSEVGYARKGEGMR